MPSRSVSIYKSRKRFPNSKTNKKEEKARGAPRKRNPNDPLTKEEAELLIRSIDVLQDRTLIFLGLNTGMRVSEIAGVEEISIDFQEGRIKIWDEKKDVYRNVYVNQDVLSSLRLYLNAREKKGPRLFPFTTKTIQNRIQKWTSSVLGKKKSWHALRHTYVSLSREMDIPMEIVVQNTGDTPATIMAVYSRASPNFIRKTINEKKIYEVKQ
jgi:integrase